ncbi:MAG: phosphatidylglycerophosphatase A [Burkholderiales bacterium]|nr:phosphatidylglycerophosphatase A [Burkholderiales bacterium]
MLGSPARAIAFGLGSGLLRPAPGTWGTLAGWAAFAIFLAPLAPAWQLAACCGGFALGVWACDRCGRDLGVADHGGMVFDEVIAFWLVLILVPATWAAQGAAFLLFRAFDIAKPQPIRHFDARWKNGFGVMFDDLLAAGYTLLLFALWMRLTS